MISGWWARRRRSWRDIQIDFWFMVIWTVIMTSLIILDSDSPWWLSAVVVVTLAACWTLHAADMVAYLRLENERKNDDG